MKLLLQREPSLDGATLGTLSIPGEFECFTVEDAIREIDGVDVSEWKVPGKTCIPQGTYRVVIDFSNRFQRKLMHVINVPGFSGVRIHPGNTAVETEGCILPGQVKGHASVARSVLALDALQPRVQAALARGEQVWLEVRNP